MTLHPQVVKKNGRKEFVILPYEEFQAMQERMEDLEDFAALRAAIREDDPSVPSRSLEEVRAELGLVRGRVRPRRSRVSTKRRRLPVRK